jgi:hypothetical protein
MNHVKSKSVYAAALALISFASFQSNAKADPALAVKATYTVPVDDPALTQYATFPITQISATTNPDMSVTMKYRMPQELTGQPVDVSFQGPAGDPAPTLLTGPQGTMTCTGNTCQVAFNKNLPIDQAQVRGVISLISQDPTEQKNRLAVSEMFANSGDGPHGVLIYYPGTTAAQ